MRTALSSLVLLIVGLSTACSGEIQPPGGPADGTPEADARSDSGTVGRDGSAAEDAVTAADVGGPEDAGAADSGVAADDGGLVPDAGLAGADAGFASDAGLADAGSAADAGLAGLDAGLAADAGAAPDAGPGGGQSFALRCAAPGVVKCVGFDDPADFNIGNGGTSGAYGLNSGIFPPYGTSDYSRAVQDTALKASGAGSLKFTIPPNSPSDSSGSYFTNFSSDLSVQFGENQDIYIQWRQRFSPEMIQTQFASGGGWKQLILGTGDTPSQLSTSCSSLEVVTQNTGQRGFAQLYNSCSGSTSHGPYFPFEEPFASFDFKLQNARPAPYCLYSQQGSDHFPPTGNCIGYAPDEWMTFQLHVRTGPRQNDEFVGSIIDLDIGRENQPSEPAYRYGPFNLSAGDPAENQRFGKVWLLPYHTNKSAQQAHPTAYTWYDELIISRQRIADPVGGTQSLDAGTSDSGSGSPDAGFSDAGSSAPDAGFSAFDAGTAPDGSALGALASSMAPGTWAQLTPANDQNAILGVGGVSMSMMHYSNNCAWNPQNQSIEIVGGDHNYGATMRYVRYVSASNTFVLLNAGGNSSDSGTGPGHTYDHLSVNPYTGDSYMLHYTGVGVSQIVATRAPLNTNAFSQSLPLSPQTVTNITFGSVWWSGPFAGAGAQGCLVVFNAGNSQPGGSMTDGQITAFDPLSNSWFMSALGRAPFYGTAGSTYHEVADYSAVKNVMVYGGGNDAPTRLWRLDGAGNSSPMPNTPAGAAVGVQGGTLVAEPQSGNFLLLSNAQLWELNPDGAGSWSLQAGPRAPPPGLGSPGPGVVRDGIQACAIPEHGVVAFIKQTSGTGGAMYLYKHR